MLPRSSMLISRLTTTRLRARLRAPEARLTVTIAGSSCGVSPTAIASENRADSQDRSAEQRVDDEDAAGQHRGDANQQDREAAQPALERGFRLPFAEPQRDLAERGARAGLQRRSTVPSHPERSCPCRRSSAGRARPGRRRAPGSAALGLRHRLTGEDRLVALELARLEEPQVGGHQVAGAQQHDVARHQLGDVHRHGGPSRRMSGPVADAGVQRLDDTLGAILVEEAEADAQGDDGQDDDRVRALADHEAR